MNGDKKAEFDFDASVIWEEVRRAAARAPKWASTDPPYSVREGFIGSSVTEAQAPSVGSTRSEVTAEPSDLKSVPDRSSFRERIARFWRG